jgi:YegS/Rv2252/BmrU family lipid kinase
MKSVKRIVVLVNPTAANSSGHRLWAQITPRFEALFSSYECQIIETRSGEHSRELGLTTDADLIIAVGGDGTLHDIAQGIMHRPREDRPILAMIPIGSGNDFARTIGMPLNPQRALETISEGVRTAIDIGRCNEVFFLETLSFGIDAAIALKTVEMRKTIRNRGFLLYARAAISAILNDLKPYHFCITADDQETIDEDLLICAIQNGPTYGEGFRIAPKARVNDGVLNACLTLNISKLYALYVLAAVARGKHESLAAVRMLNARRITVDLQQEVPAQCDGEPLTGMRFEIELLPAALDIILPRGASL